MKFLVIGDSIVDNFVLGEVNRQSPEDQSVPLLDFVEENTRPGGCLNVAANVAHLLSAGSVFVSTFMCEYTDRYLLSDHNINTSLSHIDTGAYAEPSQEELIKTRFINKATQRQLLRSDNRKNFSEHAVKSFLEKFQSIKLNDFDCVIVSDYNKGLITEDIICKLHEYNNGTIFVDTKKHDLGLWDIKNCIIKISINEYADAINKEKVDTLILTQGSSGSVLLKNNQWKQHFPTEYVKNADITGAGDVFLAAISAMFTETGDIVKSIEYATKAATSSVKKFGTTIIDKNFV